MKFQLLILFLFISCLANAQTYSDLIGKVYTRNEEKNQFKKCIQIDARVDSERYICKYYLDTTRNKAIIIIEKENSDDTIYTYKIIDVVE